MDSTAQQTCADITDAKATPMPPQSQPPVTTVPPATRSPEDPPKPPQEQDKALNITATVSECKRFVKYDINGTIFEVTAKYKPPIHIIGKGAFGIVCSILNSNTEELVAIKKIADAFGGKALGKMTLREIKLLRHMDHENIIAIRDVIPPPPHRREAFDDVYVAFELMGTDLHATIQCYKGLLTEKHHQYFLYQILRGLKYIHSANILHRDLKPSNLLINSTCDLKICDFGHARVISETDYMTHYVVTRWYRAPELLLQCPHYTAAIDVWSVGCIFMELIHGKVLFCGRDRGHQLRLIMELLGTPSETDMESFTENARRYIRYVRQYQRQSFCERFPGVNPLAIDLVEKMLTFDPRQRMTVDDALAHPYLELLHQPSDEPVCTTPFQSDLEQQDLTEEQIRELIYSESLTFNPEFQQQ